MSAPMSNYSQRDNPNNTKFKTLKADKHQIHNTKNIEETYLEVTSDTAAHWVVIPLVWIGNRNRWLRDFGLKAACDWKVSKELMSSCLSLLHYCRSTQIFLHTLNESISPAADGVA